MKINKDKKKSEAQKKLVTEILNKASKPIDKHIKTTPEGYLVGHPSIVEAKIKESRNQQKGKKK